MDLNEKKASLKGRVNISKELELGKCYDLTVKDAECREVKEIPCDDGTKNIIYSIVVSELSEMNIISENGVIPAKKKGSQEPEEYERNSCFNACLKEIKDKLK